MNKISMCNGPKFNHEKQLALCAKVTEVQIVKDRFLEEPSSLARKEFLPQSTAIGDKIKCPCPKCGSRKWQTRKIVFNHLIDKPFPKNYVTWFMHGEMNVLHNSRNREVTQDVPPTENPVELLINEAFGGLRHEGVDVGPSQVVGEEEMLHDIPASNNKDLFELLGDGRQELYEGSKYSKLEFLLKLYHIKCLSGLSDKGMTMILDLLKDAFKFAKIPNSFYEAKKTIKKLCLDYIKIDVCPNDCMLYWEDDVNAETCKYCHTSRWKPENESNKDHAPTTSLASDGFNPFGTMSTNYSIWPVVLVPYNLPPWLCMKQPNFILSMIILGPRTAGNNIDVYLQPLIKELNELWREGVDTFDSSKDEMFRMRAALMWTISDFPGLDILSGWNTHTSLACPSCNFDAEPCRLRHSRKWCFIGHRRFLGRNHKFRLMRHRFDGNVEERTPPKKLSGSDILQQVKDISVTFGRQAELSGKRKRNGKGSVGEGATQQWRKKSIFFDLPYWEFNSLRHNLDVMHIEKNVFDNIIYSLLNDKEKSKDHVKARRDLQDMGIRHDLWPDENDECRLGAFTIPKEKKVTFLKTLKNISVPDGYSSNISRCVYLDQKRIFGLKSHDCHILMEQLLPIAIRNVLPNQVVATLVELSSFFRHLCLKSLTLADLEKLQNRIVETLCHLEMLFPPSFFAVMVHLTIHLVDEVIQGGPVHYRWMYFVERLLGHLKSLVGNRSQPEGSIAEGYIVEEALTFCSRYFEGIESRLNRPKHVNDEPNCNEASEKSSMFPQQGKPVGGSTTEPLTLLEKTQAHRYVLLNCATVKPFVDEFRHHIRRSRGRKLSPTEVERRVSKEFADWFPKRIMNPDIADTISDDMKFLAQGPAQDARRFSAYNINGFKFRTLSREQGLKTQNSGVFLVSDTSCVASSADRYARQADLPYYGRLEDIIELNYYGRFRVVLFKCQWADTTRNRGFKSDVWKFNCVNFSKLIHTGDREDDDPYIEASQANMVYYVDDETDK
ncbi:uncharacterized protein LOC132612901 [Lycium barbarum]|uniref:uncharacterized protein LOC132612901 n=1 Tax=Lycium barbarum TaxID=112863 RepID=UPI00293E2320|nr:uncharacterized protein LOC132612901 [Lycium barbarum]